jgi:hypothetical protein
LDPAGIPIATRGNEQEHPTVASDGRGSFVSWSDRRSSFYDIYGARVTRAGKVLEARGILLSTAPSTDCVVPRVIGMQLGQARKRLRRANCAVGRVRRVKSRRGIGRVVAQKPRRGEVRRPRYPVSLVVGRR